MPRDTHPLVLRTADGLGLAVDAWLDLVAGMGHAYGTRGLEPITAAVAWCLGVPADAPLVGLTPTTA